MRTHGRFVSSTTVGERTTPQSRQRHVVGAPSISHDTWPVWEQLRSIVVSVSARPFQTPVHGSSMSLKMSATLLCQRYLALSALSCFVNVCWCPNSNIGLPPTRLRLLRLSNGAVVVSMFAPQVWSFPVCSHRSLRGGVASTGGFSTDTPGTPKTYHCRGVVLVLVSAPTLVDLAEQPLEVACGGSSGKALILGS